jgi:hypothetical protein
MLYKEGAVLFTVKYELKYERLLLYIIDLKGISTLPYWRIKK